MEVASGGFTEPSLSYPGGNGSSERRVINMIGKWKRRLGFGWYKTEEPFSWAETPISFVALPAAGDQMDRKLSLSSATQTWPLKHAHEGVRELRYHGCSQTQALGRHNLGKCAEFSQPMGTGDQFEIKCTSKYSRLGTWGTCLEKLSKPVVDCRILEGFPGISGLCIARMRRATAE